MKEKKKGDSMLCNGVTRENARASVCARFFIKCLKCPETYANKIWDDFEHFEILRAHWRAGRSRMRAFFDLTLTGRILTLIMVNMNEKWLFGYEDMIMSWFSENFTKWRLDDIIRQGQGWKCYFDLFICLYICVSNFKAFDWTISKLSC